MWSAAALLGKRMQEVKQCSLAIQDPTTGTGGNHDLYFLLHAVFSQILLCGLDSPAVNWGQDQSHFPRNSIVQGCDF